MLAPRFRRVARESRGKMSMIRGERYNQNLPLQTRPSSRARSGVTAESFPLSWRASKRWRKSSVPVRADQRVQGAHMLSLSSSASSNAVYPPLLYESQRPLSELAPSAIDHGTSGLCRCERVGCSGLRLSGWVTTTRVMMSC